MRIQTPKHGIGVIVTIAAGLTVVAILLFLILSASCRGASFSVRPVSSAGIPIPHLLGGAPKTQVGSEHRDSCSQLPVRRDRANNTGARPVSLFTGWHQLKPMDVEELT